MPDESKTPAQPTAQELAIIRIRQIAGETFDAFVFIGRTSTEDGESDRYNFSKSGADSDCMGMADIVHNSIERGIFINLSGEE